MGVLPVAVVTSVSDVPEPPVIPVPETAQVPHGGPNPTAKQSHSCSPGALDPTDPRWRPPGFVEATQEEPLRAEPGSFDAFVNDGAAHEKWVDRVFEIDDTQAFKATLVKRRVNV